MQEISYFNTYIQFIYIYIYKIKEINHARDYIFDM